MLSQIIKFGKYPASFRKRKFNSKHCTRKGLALNGACSAVPAQGTALTCLERQGQHKPSGPRLRGLADA